MTSKTTLQRCADFFYSAGQVLMLLASGLLVLTFVIGMLALGVGSLLLGNNVSLPSPELAIRGIGLLLTLFALGLGSLILAGIFGILSERR